MGAIAQQCTHIPLFVGDMETFPGDSASPRFSLFNTLRRVRYIKKTIRRLDEVHPDVVFQTQPSVHFLPRTQTLEFIYRPMDVEASDFYHMGLGLPKEGWKRPYSSLVRKYRNSIIEGSPDRHLFALSR